jgi:hypothetical protein
MESIQNLSCVLWRGEAETRGSPLQSGLVPLIVTLAALALWTPTAAVADLLRRHGAAD